MKYMDTKAIINVKKVKLLARPVTMLQRLEEDINKAIADDWELAEIRIDPEDKHAYAQLIRIKVQRVES